MSEEMLEGGAAAEAQGTEGGAAEKAGGEGTVQNSAQNAGQNAENPGSTLLSASAAAADGAGEGTDAAGQDSAPKAYDLKSPEGSRWEEAHMQAFQQQARELGLSNEQAQKMLDMAHGNQQAAMEAHQAQVKQWFNEIRMDKEMGGAAFAATDMYATAAIKKFDHEGRLAELLQTSGYVNHPEVIRALSRVGRALGDDGLVTGKEAAAQAPLEDRLYPNSNK